MKTKNKKHHLVAHIASLGSGGVSGITYRPVLPRSPLMVYILWPMVKKMKYL